MTHVHRVGGEKAPASGSPDVPGATAPGGSFSWRIGGLAGEGIDTAGDLLAKACMRDGWRVWTTRHFPSRIRGGLTTYTVRLASHEIAAPSGGCDLMVALHQDGVNPARAGLSAGGVMLYDPAAVKPPLDQSPTREAPDGEASGPGAVARSDGPQVINGVLWLPVSCTALAKQTGEPRARNVVALGASAELLGLSLDALEGVVMERFGGAKRGQTKVPETAAKNAAALRAGAEAVRSLGVSWSSLAMPPRAESTAGHLFVAGNEAFAYGALVAGCRFYAGYPITPATTIMEYLSAHLPGYGGVCLQVEDEIAAANMVIGAGFAGARALTATSGPGLSLMAEAMGLAGSTETPVVIVDCLRPGPSTGMPTKTGQEDLAFLVAGGHGEVPHIVLSAEDLPSAFEVAVESFDLAERYQCAVYVMIEAALAMGKGDCAAFDLDRVVIDRGHRVPRGGRVDAAEDDTDHQAVLGQVDGAVPGLGAAGTGEGYARYAAADGGVPLRAVPGDVGGRHYANSTEHGPAGYTTELVDVRRDMVERRDAKLADIQGVHRGVRFEGDADGALGVLAHGSAVPVMREALEIARRHGVAGELAVLRRVHPLPAAELDAFFARHERVLVFDGNATGQLLLHLRAHCRGAHDAESLRKYDGDPLRIDEVLPHVLRPTEATS